MKINNLMNKKIMVRVAAGLVIVTVVGAGFSTYSVNVKRLGAQNAQTTETVINSAISADELSDKLSDSVKVTEKNVGKEETVFFLSDASGNINKTIVSDHLKNADKKTTLTDRSSLTDINNTKGDEKFTQNGYDLTWAANGGDIYYQGTTTQQAPVKQKVTYFLNGTEIKPDDLAGKSGKIRIRFDYTNTATATKKVNGEVYTVNVPFAAVTGVVLNDSFTNVEVTNGKIASTGKDDIAIGYALPGFKESLNIQDGDLSNDANIPEYFEITADVKDFSLDTAMTMVVNATDLASIDGLSDTSDLDKLVDELVDAGKQLKDGSSELADGIDTLKGSMGEFSDGVNTLSDGITAYTDGANSVNDGITALKDGIEQLAASTPALADGVNLLSDGADKAQDGASQLVAGYEGDGTAENPGLVNGAKTVSAGAKQISDGVGSLTSKIGAQLEATKTDIKSNYKTKTGIDYDSDADNNNAQYTATLDSLKALDNALKTAIAYSEGAAKMETDREAYFAAGDTTTATQYGTSAEVLNNMASQYYSNTTILNGLIRLGVITEGTLEIKYDTAKKLSAGIEAKIDAFESGKGQADGAIQALTGVETSLSTNEDLKTLVAGAKQLSDGAASVSDGANQLYAGTKQLSDGVKDLNGGIKTLQSNVPALTGGVGKLSDGAGQLLSGSDKLVSNNFSLLAGVSALKDGTSQIVDKLSDGAGQLKDGIATFNDEAIQKIADSYKGDLKPFANRVQAVMDAGSDYGIFTDTADGVEGSVKFVYKLASISK